MPVDIPLPSSRWLDLLPDAALIADRDGRIHCRTGELIGQPMEVLVPERLRTAHAAHRETFLAQPRARPMGAGLDLSGRRQDGSEFPAEIGISPIESDGRKPGGRLKAWLKAWPH